MRRAVIVLPSLVPGLVGCVYFIRHERKRCWLDAIARERLMEFDAESEPT